MIYEPTSARTKPHRRQDTDPRVQSWLDEIADVGFCVIEDAFSSEQVTQAKTELAPWLQKELMGRNNFEGHSSERVYALLAKAPVIAEMIEHPDVLAIADAILEPNYLLSAALAINVHPGETPQPWHIDDGAGDYAFPKPRAPMGLSAIWALDEFTQTNGATEVIPGSHRWEQDRVPQDGEQVSVCMPRGFSVGVCRFAGASGRGQHLRLCKARNHAAILSAVAQANRKHGACSSPRTGKPVQPAGSGVVGLFDHTPGVYGLC